MIHNDRPLYLPVILGTSRQGRMSEPVARFVHEELAERPGVESELLDVLQFHLPRQDAGRAIALPEFSERMEQADGVVIVAPEYNHGYPGALKRLLDTALPEYVHEAAGVVGVSSGPFGGTRMVQNLLPVLRELGLVTIFWDVNVSQVHAGFDDSGKLQDPALPARMDKFLKELVWMARTLRYGRRHISIDRGQA
ncbi:MAG: NAD(P)H-dependent oxidoreductase [Actinomycetota bacterium]|nr:NAD(P)H-dependent oxidoreductase [Actinomycetota bacterium]